MKAIKKIQREFMIPKKKLYSGRHSDKDMLRWIFYTASPELKGIKILK